MAPFLRRGVSHVAQVEEFVGARVLARADGIFLLRIEVTERFPPDNLDELAFAACMAAKENLGHRHDVHMSEPRRRALLPGRPRRRRLGDSIGDILVHDPVRLDPSDAVPLFVRDSFSDDDLRTLKAAHDKEPGRNALICLRRAFLEVFEHLQGVIKDDRDHQRQVERSFVHPLLLGIVALVVLFLLYVAFLGWPPDELVRMHPVELVLSLVILSSATWTFLHNARQFLNWDSQRIRLLRSSEIFYHYVNPVNAVIDRVLNNQLCAAPRVTDFSALLGILQVKVVGESQRAAFRQFWMMLTVSVVAIYFAALAIQEGAKTIAQSAAAEINLAALDCGADARYAVGPFPLGVSDRVEAGGRSPSDVMGDLMAQRGGDKISALVLVGSTDGRRVRPNSHLESNGALARARAAWVAAEIRNRGLARDASIRIYTLNDGMRVARAQFDAAVSGREVFVCAS